MDQPTFFLSSTIYDFSDLRSALKDYLELRGCKVLASEFTDFEQPLDKHSYEACLDTIEKADFFVLFIGRRVGGWYDEPNKISITRAEYRRAYELASAKKLRILCFIRSEVWNHRQSVQDLQNALKADLTLNPTQREKLANHPTQAMDNADVVISFIKEVTKNSETQKAVKGLGTAPIANWIWPFTTFSEVRQAIDPLVLNGFAVRDAAGRKALEAQLVTMLVALIPRKGVNTLFDPTEHVLKIVEELNLSYDKINETIKIKKSSLKLLGYLTLKASIVKVDPAPYHAYLSSGLLLKYDPANGTYNQTHEFDLLVQLIENISRLDKTDSLNFSELHKYVKPNDLGDFRMIPVEILAKFTQRLLRWVDVIQIGKALAQSIAGKPATKIKTVPLSPLIDQAPGLEAESATSEQVRAFLGI